MNTPDTIGVVDSFTTNDAGERNWVAEVGKLAVGPHRCLTVEFHVNAVIDEKFAGVRATAGRLALDDFANILPFGDEIIDRSVDRYGRRRDRIAVKCEGICVIYKVHRVHTDSFERRIDCVTHLFRKGNGVLESRDDVSKVSGNLHG